MLAELLHPVRERRGRLASLLWVNGRLVRSRGQVREETANYGAAVRRFREWLLSLPLPAHFAVSTIVFTVMFYLLMYPAVAIWRIRCRATSSKARHLLCSRLEFGPFGGIATAAPSAYLT